MFPGSLARMPPNKTPVWPVYSLSGWCLPSTQLPLTPRSHPHLPQQAPLIHSPGSGHSLTSLPVTFPPALSPNLARLHSSLGELTRLWNRPCIHLFLTYNLPKCVQTPQTDSIILLQKAPPVRFIALRMTSSFSQGPWPSLLCCLSGLLLSGPTPRHGSSRLWPHRISFIPPFSSLVLSTTIFPAKNVLSA